MMSVKCEEPIDEKITVQVWLLYHHPNFKYCTFVCKRDIITLGARLMHVGDSSIYLNWLLENMYNKVPNSNSGKNYELF